MSKTSTGERFNPFAAASPPNPPPTITTRGALVVISSLSHLQFWNGISLQTTQNRRVLPYPFGRSQVHQGGKVRTSSQESSNRIAAKQSHVHVIRRCRQAFFAGSYHPAQSFTDLT